MHATFFAVIANVLGPDFAMTLANRLRPQARLLFARLLPEMPKPGYTVSGGSMTIRPTMAGLAAMDSPYPPGGVIETSAFLEETAKIANHVRLTEKLLREVQALIDQLQLAGGNTNEALVNTLLNFAEKVIVQPHIDTMEWLRSRALVYGLINWTYNNVNLTVDYGLPLDHLFDTRAGNDSYGGSTSRFWEDDRRAQRLLRNRSGIQRIMHSDTWDFIVQNPANMIEVVSQSGQDVQIRRLVTRGGNTLPTSDARETFSVTLYDEEGELLNPRDTSKTVKVPFCDPGRILYVAPTADDGFRIGQGATDDPEEQRTLGYTHIAPTVEGKAPSVTGARQLGGGRWARVFAPEDMPMNLVGEGVTNGLPVIEQPKRLAVASTIIS